MDYFGLLGSPYFSKHKEGSYTLPCLFPVPHLKGIGDKPNKEVLEASRTKPVRVARHRGCVRDEHDRFMPMWFNNMSMPVNIKD